METRHRDHRASFATCPVPTLVEEGVEGRGRGIRQKFDVEHEAVGRGSERLVKAGRAIFDL